MPLSDTSIKAAKPKAASYKLSDDKGLFLLVAKSGSKLWRLKYRFHDKEKLLAIGAYPEIGLKDARKRRDEARTLLAEGKDPGEERKRKALSDRITAETTFKSVADEFLAKLESEGLAPRTNVKNRWLSSLIEDELGSRPVSGIEPMELLMALKRVEKRGNHETAKRMRALASRIFKYAIITGRARHNPAADLDGALVSRKTKHYAAILDPIAVGHLLNAIDSFEGFPATQFALRLAPHLFVRPGELRQAEWTEIDFAAKVWRIPASKMKMRLEHVVPLSRQALTILQEAKEIACKSKFIFPSVRTGARPMSDNTLNVALRRIGYRSDEMTAHGFRSTASTLLNESGKWSADAIERSLAHQDANKVRSAYHRGAHWAERVEMAQWWSDYLDSLKGINVVEFSRKSSQPH